MPRNAVAYDEDFFAWTEQQARLLRAREFSQLDIANLAEEMEDMGRGIRRELRNRLAVLTMHLLKWRYQPGYRSRSWSGTIKEQRQQIAELLDESPSLKPVLARDLTRIYRLSVSKALGETGLPEAVFPAECPFTPDQILAEEFLPEE
ncbi:MAG TPA: DUF29 domain-containing protein [Stellaceae bacterium]|nr:DUF29 domain-containing protein [Stellaceae bacterium]